MSRNSELKKLEKKVRKIYKLLKKEKTCEKM